MTTSRATWKQFERQIAEDWTSAIGLLCKRNICSGANNRTDKGDPRPGDVVIHSHFNADVLLEAKLRSSFLHHSLFKNAEKDAKKHSLSQVLLFTKQKGDKGYLVILRSELFYKLLSIPGVQKMFRKESE